MRRRGPDFQQRLNGGSSEEMPFNQGAKGWDGGVGWKKMREEEGMAQQVEGYRVTPTATCRGGRERGSVLSSMDARPGIHHCVRRGQGLRWKELSIFAKLEEGPGRPLRGKGRAHVITQEKKQGWAKQNPVSLSRAFGFHPRYVGRCGKFL